MAVVSLRNIMLKRLKFEYDAKEQWRRWYNWVFELICYAALGMLFTRTLTGEFPIWTLVLYVFLTVFLVFMEHFPWLYMYPGAWYVEGEARRRAAPYGVSALKALRAFNVMIVVVAEGFFDAWIPNVVLMVVQWGLLLCMVLFLMRIRREGIRQRRSTSMQEE